MNILFLNRVYPPAPGATGELLAELAQALCERGNAVTILTSRAAVDGPADGDATGRSRPRVVRVAGLPFTRAAHWKRALSYLSLYPAFLWRALRLPRPDVVVTMTDPPLQLVLGPVLKWRRGCRLVHWAQDVYPEIAEELGVLRPGGLPARFLRRLANGFLRRHDCVIAIGECMRERLVKRGLPADRVVVVPNWAKSETSCHEPTSESGGSRRRLPGADFRDAHALTGRFVVMYSGNFGLVHEFAGILGAAEQMRTIPAIQFVLIGDGPRLAAVRQEASARGLDNVRFLPFQPAERLAETLAAADVHVVSMRKSVLGLVVPSKVYGVLAAGRPCVFLGPRECAAARLLEGRGCGAVLPSTDAAGLAACLRRWLEHPDELERLRHRAEAGRGAVGLASVLAAFEAALVGAETETQIKC